MADAKMTDAGEPSSFGGTKVSSFMVCGTRFDVPARYTLMKPIGHGAYGVVYKARRAGGDDHVAVKVIKKSKLARRAKRAGRFAADAAKAPPPIPKRTFAHPGGKITSNKEEATATFLRRKEAQSQAPAAAQRPAIYDEEPE